MFDSPNDLLARVAEAMRLCCDSKRGKVSLGVRKLGADELEISLYSYCGSVRCSPTAFRESLDDWNTVGHDMIHYRCFIQEVIKTLPKGYFSIELDFKRDSHPVLYSTASSQLRL